jgi:hypothetical protein
MARWILLLCSFCKKALEQFSFTKKVLTERAPLEIRRRPLCLPFFSPRSRAVPRSLARHRRAAHRSLAIGRLRLCGTGCGATTRPSTVRLAAVSILSATPSLFPPAPPWPAMIDARFSRFFEWNRLVINDLFDCSRNRDEPWSDSSIGSCPIPRQFDAMFCLHL